MISKVIYSKNLSGSLHYILEPKKRAEVVLARKISSMFNVDAIIRDFERQSMRRPSCKVKAVHIPISFHVNDSKMLESNYEQILSDWLQRMEDHGYRFDQFVIGRHHDKDEKNPHFHFLGNLILDNGERAFIANIGKAAKECSITVTEKWGLTPANHKKLSIENHHITYPTKKISTSKAPKAHSVASDQESSIMNTDTFNNVSDSAEGSPTNVGDMLATLLDIAAPMQAPRVGTGSGSSDNSLDYYREQDRKQRNKKGGRR